MKWVSRARPKTDRIACPWLVCRFIDPDAEFVFVPADEVLDTARRVGGYSFDAAGADFTHEAGRCTFGDPALVELTRIVHAADITADVQAPTMVGDDRRGTGPRPLRADRA